MDKSTKNKLYILIGPPGIGKSTWAKENVDVNKNLRINRDELRSMLAGKYLYGNWRLEKMVTKISREVAEEAFRNELDVILDNTNCNLKTIKQLIAETPENIEIKWVIFKLPYWKQRLRIIKRWLSGGVYIKSKVSRSMNKGYSEVVDFLKERTSNSAYTWRPYKEVKL